MRWNLIKDSRVPWDTLTEKESMARCRYRLRRARELMAIEEEAWEADPRNEGSKAWNEACVRRDDEYIRRHHMDDPFSTGFGI